MVFNGENSQKKTCSTSNSHIEICLLLYLIGRMLKNNDDIHDDLLLTRQKTAYYSRAQNKRLIARRWKLRTPNELHICDVAEVV